MYLSESDWKQFQKELGESYTGIGVSVSIDPDSSRLKVLARRWSVRPAYVAAGVSGPATRSSKSTASQPKVGPATKPSRLSRGGPARR